MRALTFSVPCADWLTPCEYSVTTRGVFLNIRKNSATSASMRPGASAVAATLPAMLRARAGELHEETAEQRGVGAGLQPQHQIGVASGIGPARIDHHDARAAPLLV